MKHRANSRLRTAFAFAAFGTHLLTASAGSLRKHPSKMSQDIVIDGKKVPPGSEPLPARQVLSFDVLGITANDLNNRGLSPAQQRDILQRMNDLRDVVDKENTPGRPAAEIVTALKAQQGVQKDLSKLLIAALVSNTNGDVTTLVWSYQSLSDKPAVCGPTVETTPGALLLIPVLNLLDPVELANQSHAKDLNGKIYPVQDPVPTGPDARLPMNAPNAFDVINLHTHGLNVSPQWPSDDVFRQIRPRELKFYLYVVPPEQPPGTFFYHPHHHGSTATLVAGGMAGPLIVRDPAHGLDQLGEANGWGKAREETLLFQQFTLYRNLGEDKLFYNRPDFFALKDTGPWTGDKPQWVRNCVGDRKIVGDIASVLFLEDGTSRITKEEVQTWVSGHLQPRLFSDEKTKLTTIMRGEFRRLRLIHGGVEENINLRACVRFPKLANGDENLTPTVEEFEHQPQVKMQVIAWDGIPLRTPFFIGSKPDDAAHPEKNEQALILSPGNRADVLLEAPTDAAPGAEYALYSLPSEPDQPLILLASFTVGTTDVAPLPKWVTFAHAQAMHDHDSTAVPHLPSTSIPPVEERFFLSFGDASVDKDGKFTPGTFSINCQPFPGNEIDFRIGRARRLSFLVQKAPADDGKHSHPLHIHVNPFLVAPEPQGSPNPTRKSKGLPPAPFWADTLLLQSQDTLPIRVTMPFDRWTGRAVGHCHILDHEDAGMMNLIDIEPAVKGFPEVPLAGLMDMPKFPNFDFAKLRLGQKHAAVAGRVVIYVFMPPPTGGTTCTHCTASVRAISEMRRQLPDAAKVQIIVVSGTAADLLPTVKDLGLADTDGLYGDPSFSLFEKVGLIDGTPSQKFDEKLRRIAGWPTFRAADKKVENLMHGLFIQNIESRIVSSRRGFTAFTDTDQILAEVENAKKTSAKMIGDFQQELTDLQTDPAKLDPPVAVRLWDQVGRLEEALKSKAE